MSIKSDGFLLFVSINFFTQKLGVWKHRLFFFSVKYPRMIPQKVILVSCEPGFFTLWARFCPRSGLHLLLRARDALGHLLDHPGWFGVNWLCCFIGGSWVMGWFVNLYSVLKNRVFGNLGCPGNLIPYIPGLFESPDPREMKFSTLIPKVPTMIPQSP